MINRRKRMQTTESSAEGAVIEQRSATEIMNTLSRKVSESHDSCFDLYQFAPVASIILDQRGRIIESNLKAASMLGVERPAMLRMNFVDFVHRGSRKQWHVYRKNAFAVEAMHTCEVELKGIDGLQLSVRLEGNTFGPEGDRRCHAALIDITTERTAGEAPTDKSPEQRVPRRTHQIRRHERLFRRIGDQAPVMIWICGTDKLCIWVNRPWLNFTGRTMEQELGNGWTTVIHPDDRPRCMDTYVTAFDARQPFAMEYRVRHRDGDWRWILDHGSPTFGDGGTFTGYMGSCIDITERKRLEQERDRYRDDLRAMASELMLAEERERQRLSESLHDGPSQAIFRARLKLDQLSVTEPRAKEITAILEDIGKMINTMTFELSPVVLRTLGLRHAIRSLASDMERRYGLFLKIRDDGTQISLDERMTLVLFRSVRELLINIVKHAKTTKASLSLKRVDDSLEIEIEDRGSGFDPADQSGHVVSGHFGLFSIRERLAYLGGSATLRSAPGKGTCVTLNAPLIVQAASAAAAGST